MARARSGQQLKESKVENVVQTEETPNGSLDGEEPSLLLVTLDGKADVLVALEGLLSRVQ